MASLMLQDSFEPYYARRDDEVVSSGASCAAKERLREQGSRQAIILPSQAPAPIGEVRRDRRVVAH